MKKVMGILFIGSAVLFAASCKKDYHCSCTFRNNNVYSTDLGAQYKNDAQNKCNAYDSTVQGETWNCTLY